jgi:hypothetical protein
MRRGWLALALLLALMGCGSKEQRSSDVAACQVDAAKAYPNVGNDRDIEAKANSTVALCMDGKGYRWDADPIVCPADSAAINGTNPGCYKKPGYWY